jgi:hypothetical protein
MPIISPADLSTNLYAGTIDEITRSDASITQRAINAAIQEAKMFLTRFDLVQLFGTDTDGPSVPDEYLKSLVKDIACWHLIRLSSTGVDQATCRQAYQDALAALKSIQAGQAQPAGWPYATTSPYTAPSGDAIAWSSNPKRNNFY